MHKSKHKRGKEPEVHAAELKISEKQLVKLESERLKNTSKLLKEMEDVQARLNQLGHSNRSYESITSDVQRRYYKQKHFERILSQDERTNFPFGAYVLMGIAALIIGASSYIIFTEPSITGFAVEGVQGITKIATNQVMSTTLGIVAVIGILGVVLHTAEHRHKHRHDRFKPPMPPE